MSDKETEMKIDGDDVSAVHIPPEREDAVEEGHQVKLEKVGVEEISSEKFEDYQRNDCQPIANKFCLASVQDPNVKAATEEDQKFCFPIEKQILDRYDLSKQDKPSMYNMYNYKKKYVFEFYNFMYK